jgi:hypothetical protein
VESERDHPAIQKQIPEPPQGEGHGRSVVIQPLPPPLMEKGKGSRVSKYDDAPERFPEDFIQQPQQPSTSDIREEFAVRPKALYLFAGHKRKADIGELLRRMKWQVEEFDLVRFCLESDRGNLQRCFPAHHAMISLG